jgi:hypothetical protein
MYRTVSPHGLSRVLIRMPPSRDRALIRWDPHPSPRPSTFAQPQRPSSRSWLVRMPRALILMPALSHATAPNISISPLRDRPPYPALRPSRESDRDQSC